MQIPLDKTCPVCCKYRPRDGAWAEGPYGEVICRPCLRKMDREDLPMVAPSVELPSECPFCRRAPLDRSYWVDSAEGLMCRRCACDTNRLKSGECRVDRKGRYFKVCVTSIDDGSLADVRRAQYTFGDRPLPLWSEPALLSELEGQEAAMWTTVISNMGLARSLCAHCVTLRWFPYSDMDTVLQDAALPAMMCAAVMHKKGKAKFSTYAYRSMYHSVMRWSRRRMRQHKRHQYFDQDVEDTSLSFDQDAEEYFDRSLKERASDELNLEERVSEDQHKRDVDIRDAQLELQSIKHLLSDTDVQVLELKFVENMTYEQVGLHFGVRPQAPFLRVKRIRRRVEECG